MQTMIAEEIGKSVRDSTHQIIADAILMKLDKQGVPTDDIPIQELVEWFVDGQEGEFTWGEDDGRLVNIDLTNEEAEELMSQIEEVVNLATDPAVFQECLTAVAEVSLGALEEYWPERKIQEESELSGFRERLKQTWGAPIESFRMMLSISRELFLVEAESLRKSKAKTGRNLREALLGIHARALRTATAILVLLESGLADEAYARWRTLYELLSPA